ncbi:hypothetical protein EUTSA_v10019009mg [Eutrema salsugineum]|uniref:Uncharacterized protein n=1 Tax=Eutrema salsugineum TaxID=72664 RepID=V4JQS9_EUTSA|nr:uncharacterized protein LOC18008749 [Eutrema salsugineum]ESQ27560.1 hypothetical protein EUTSA_v10019009mg [Eutrema salsugineum]
MWKKKKNKQSTTMEDHHGSLRYRDGEVKEDFFDKTDYEVSTILLELSHPVVFSSNSLCLHKWGRTKKRSSSILLNPPVIKSLPCTDVGEMGSTSSSSCLTGEAKKTNPQSFKKGLEEEFSTTNQRSKPQITSQPNASCSLLEAEMGLIRAQVGLLAQQPIGDQRRIDYQNLFHPQPSICGGDRTAYVRDVETTSMLHQGRGDLERRGFDLNLPAAEEGNRIDTMFGFHRVANNKAQAAAQARQRRLGLIRSKKLSSRFISPQQFK